MNLCTVKPVLSDHPKVQGKVVVIDRWSLKQGFPETDRFFEALLNSCERCGTHAFVVFVGFELFLHSKLGTHIPYVVEWHRSIKMALQVLTFLGAEEHAPTVCPICSNIQIGWDSCNWVWSQNWLHVPLWIFNSLLTASNSTASGFPEKKWHFAGSERTIFPTLFGPLVRVCLTRLVAFFFLPPRLFLALRWEELSVKSFCLSRQMGEHFLGAFSCSKPVCRQGELVMNVVR